MSYILEALKKSQQERSRGQVPDLQTLHQSVAGGEQSQPAWIHWALGWALVLALLALAFLLGWLHPWAEADKPVALATAQPSTTPVVIENAVAVPAETVAPVVRPVTQPVSVATPVEPVMPKVASQGDIAPDTVPYIEQLPSLLQESIPQMQFAGHVYSGNPQQRSVIINGHFMEEGDELMAGLRLLQITQDSVIFDQQGQRFRVAVLHDWSFK